MRAARNYKAATLSIIEKVIPERIIEPSSWLVTIILDIGSFLLGMLEMFLLFIRSKSDSILLNPKDFLTFSAVLLLCFPAVSVAGHLFGAPISRTMRNYFCKVRHEAFSEQGILYAGKIIAWEHFRGYLVSSKQRYIYLMSKYYPNAIGFSFAPTSNQDFDIVISEIAKHLPNCEFTSRDQQVGVFTNIYFQASLLSIILFLIGLTGLMMPLEIGIILITILMYLHVVASLKIVNRIIPTDRFLDAEIE